MKQMCWSCAEPYDESQTECLQCGASIPKPVEEVKEVKRKVKEK